MKVVKGLLKLLAFCAVICISYSVQAAAIQVSPVHVSLDKKHRITSLTVTNRGTSPVVVQLYIKRWHQEHGKDYYEDTQDLLVTPPIISILPSASQIIRIGLRRSVDSRQELSYRIFMREVPSFKEQHIGVQVLLELVVPVFVVPAAPTKQLDWQAQPRNKQLEIHLTNASNQHIQVSELQLVNVNTQKVLAAQKTFVYLLPAQTGAWLFPWAYPADRTLQLIATTDWGRVSERLTIPAK